MSRGFGLGLIAVLALALLAPAPAQAALAIHPAYVEFDLDGGRPSEVITVTNLLDEETRYRARVLHFYYTKEGGVEQVPPDEHSLAQWTKLNPREFTLPPKGSRVIRLSVIPPQNLATGEYWAAIEFQPLEGRISESDDGAGRTVRLEVVASIMVPIVGLVGEARYGASLEGLKAWKTENGIAISASVANTGNVRLALKGEYEVLSEAGEIVARGLIGNDTILMGGERVFTQRVQGDFPNENYTVRVRYTSGRIEETLAGQTQVALGSPDEQPEEQP